MCGRFVSSAPVWELAEYLDVADSDISYLTSDGSDPAATLDGSATESATGAGDSSAASPVSAAGAGSAAGVAGGGDADELLVPPSWNVAPTDDVWAVSARRDDAGDLRRRLRRYRWGLVPSWSKSPTVGARSFNARAETVMDKPMFRNALERRRCIIPAGAFYEWEHDQDEARSSRRKRALPWCFRPAEGDLLAFAGLWEFWREGPRPGPRGSEAEKDRSERPFLVTCTIITTDANSVVAPIHDRMPVVLARDAWKDWLSEGPLDGDLLADLLLPAPDDSLVAYRVAPLVNDVRLNGPDLVEPYVEGEADPDDVRSRAADKHGGGPDPNAAASRLFDPADLG
jgi:putative SOS response-associated peptidase YedK